MKKCIAVFFITIVMSVLCGCNRQVIDLTYSYDYAQIKMPDGTIVEGKLDSWRDYDGEQVQVVIDGVTYLVSSVNLVMVSH